MKKTQEILDLPIISISDGVEVGKVKGIIINADKGAIDYIIVDSGVQILSANVISTVDILGVGEYALTIENEGVMKDISQIPAAVDMHQKNIQVKGTKVLTKKGRLIGEIGDFYVDENENFIIIGLDYIADITQKKVRIIPRDSVITFGKNLLVVAEDVENALLDRPSQIGTGDKPIEAEKKNWVSSSNDIQQKDAAPVVPPAPAADYIAPEGDKASDVDIKDTVIEMDAPKEPDTSVSVHIPQVNDMPEEKNFEEAAAPEISDIPAVEEPELYMEEPVIEEPVVEEPVIEESVVQEPVIEQIQQELVQSADISVQANAEVQADTQKGPAENNAANLFEQRQRQYLSGRRATKTIIDNAGNVLINEGMLITDEVIDAAKQSGKLIELIMNNKA